MVSRAIRRIDLVLLALTLVVAGLAPSAAHAERVRMPVSRFNFDLPAAWRIGGVFPMGMLPVQSLRWQRGDDVGPNIMVPYDPLATDCTAATFLQAGETPFGRDWLPSGWTGKATRDSPLQTVCTDRPGFPIVLIGELSKDVRPQVLELMRALDGAWRTPPAMAAFEVVQLPQSGLKTSLPDLLVPHRSVNESDIVRLLGPKAAADFEVWRIEQSCENATLEGRNSSTGTRVEGGNETKLRPSSGPAPTGWKRFEVGTKGRIAYCSTLPGPTALVLSPGDAAIRATGSPDPTTALLTGLADWLPPVTASASPTTLPGTKATLHLLDGWTAAQNNSVDVLVSRANQLVAVTRASTPCATGFTFGATKLPFKPVWVPAGWTARFDIDANSLQACTDTPSGMLFVMSPVDRMPPHRELIAILDSLRGVAIPTAPTTSSAEPPKQVATAASEIEIEMEPTPATPTPAPASSSSVAARKPRRGPILPIPLRLAYQTIGTGEERGHGARLGIQRTFGEEVITFQVRGELGYDTVSKLGHDVQARLTLEMTDRLHVLGAAGHDAWGSNEDMPVLGGGGYGGIGASLSTSLGDHALRLDALYLWRSEINESRFAASVGYGLGPLRGFFADLRFAGELSTFLLGSNVFF